MSKAPRLSGEGGTRAGPLKAIIEAYNYVLNGLAVCAGLVIFAVFLMIVIDVTIRIAGFAPPAYTIAVAEYCLLFFTMFSAPWLVRMKGHVFIDAVTQMLPRPVQVVLAKVVYTLCVCSALTFSYISFGLAAEAIETGNLDVRGVDMPQWLLFVPMPPCFLLVAIEFMRYLVGIDDMYGDRTTARDSV